MSPTFLEITVGLIAAVLVFLFALRATPLLIAYLAQYFDRTLGADNADTKEAEQYERKH